MSTEKVRQEFIQYFTESDHRAVHSAPVVSHNDPTLLFTNAGMNQFKDVFLVQAQRDYTRAVSSQKCIRAGGKHNDLENVGHTRRHLTFFEMLGNFSFGDYFKKEAILFAWEASINVFKLDHERIWVSVFREDDEAFEIWKEIVPEERIVRFDEEENFWSMGNTGPCGPCSELHYDRGSKYGSAEHPYDDKTGDRFLEYWNLVFMQFNRDANGAMIPLPKPSIDTGAGLERIMMLQDDLDNVFQTDVLRGLIDEVEKVSGQVYNQDAENASAFHVIADHMRSLSFSIVDGAQPSNVDRGYVLRKILRRAVRYGRSLGMEEPFLAHLYPRLVDLMGEAYPELKTAESRVCEILTLEEEAFIRTLKRGGNMLNQIIDSAHKHGDKVSGDDAFKLKDTYGFPIEEILLISKDAGLEVDTKRYGILEEEAKEHSRKSHKGVNQEFDNYLLKDYSENNRSKFLGFDYSETEAKVTALVYEGKLVDLLDQGQEGWVILDQTPFYAEMGGQVGDRGTIKSDSVLFDVKDCTQAYAGIFAHSGEVLRGIIKIGDSVSAGIDEARRKRIEKNHTAAHLLHWALHEVLGGHVRQAGSLVEASRLRFDFNHHKSLTDQELRNIEDLVNAKIRENISVKTYELAYEEVQKISEIKQFFGDKYGDTVRVVDADFSKELCGGTHTSALGNIGLFRIMKESSIAAGVRRIEAISGAEAELFMYEKDDVLAEMAKLLKTQPNKLYDRLQGLLEENQELSKELKAAKKAAMGDLLSTVIDKKQVLGNLSLVAEEVNIEPSELRSFASLVMGKMSSGIVVLGVSFNGKCNLLASVSKDCQEKGIKANEIIKEIAPMIEGGGGGKADMAQAGGKNPKGLSKALERTRELFEVK